MAQKSKVAAALLCAFLGMLGIHRFYLGKTGSGVVQLILCLIGGGTLLMVIGGFVLAALGLWVFIDFILILTGKLSANE